MGRLPAACLAAAAICACFAQGAAARGPRCALRAPPQIASNPWAPAQAQLAPAGPSAVRLCRYSGLNDHPKLRLVRTLRRTDDALLTKLVREFDALPPVPIGVTSCPVDLGDEIVAKLSYPGGHAVAILVILTGCPTAINGDLVRSAMGFGDPPAFGPQLLSRLERLTR
jgi:hypothetical protein